MGDSVLGIAIKYGRFGGTVVAAVLRELKEHGGLGVVLARLGISSQGDIEDQHDALVKYLLSNDPTEFLSMASGGDYANDEKRSALASLNKGNQTLGAGSVRLHYGGTERRRIQDRRTGAVGRRQIVQPFGSEEKRSLDSRRKTLRRYSDKITSA